MDDWHAEDEKYQQSIAKQVKAWTKEAKELLKEHDIKASGIFGLYIDESDVGKLIDLLEEFKELAVGM